MKTKKTMDHLWLILSFSFFSLPFKGLSQVQVTEVFTAEIEVSPEINVFTTGPRALPINMHGTMTMDDSDYAFTIRGKGEKPSLVLVKNLEIITWNEHKIKQESTVKVSAASTSELEKIQSLLKVSLVQGADKVVVIDCNLNIKKFRLRNGFLMGDRCWLDLDDGNSLPLKTLELQTRIFIPKTCNFKIEGDFVDLKISNLQGDLNASVRHGSIDAKHVKSANLHLISTEVSLDDVANARINARGCVINANRIADLMIDDQVIRLAQDPLFDLEEEDAHSSALNKYDLGAIKKLDVRSSENDQFTVRNIEHLHVHQAIFSNFVIEDLKERLFMKARSGDLVLTKINPDFQVISIDNEISTVRLELDQLSSYRLEIDENEHLKFENPKDAQEISDKPWKAIFHKGSISSSGEIDIDCNKCQLYFKV